MVQNSLRGGEWRKIQVSLEIAVEFVEFLNIDLADPGLYQMESILKCDGRVPHCIEVSTSVPPARSTLPTKPPRSKTSARPATSPSGAPSTSRYTAPSISSSGGSLFSPQAFVQQEDAPESSLFRVRHDDQRIPLHDVLLYRVFLLVDPLQVEASIAQTEFTLSLEVFHIERTSERPRDNGEHTKRTSVGERTIKFALPHAGLHFHRPVKLLQPWLPLCILLSLSKLQILFGYSYFCQLSLSIHGTLIALQEPYRKFQSEVRGTTWKREPVSRIVEVSSSASMNAIIFGANSPHSAMPYAPPIVKEDPQELLEGKKRVTKMIRLLLVALEALQAEYTQLQPLTDKTYHIDEKEMTDCELQVALSSSEIDACPDKESVVECGQKQITQLAGAIVRIWTNFVDAFVGCLPVAGFLMESFREVQLRRLGEGVFLLDHHKSALFSLNEASRMLGRHDTVWELMKRSGYYLQLPALPVACMETDGKATEIPAIFEDRYYHVHPEANGNGECHNSHPPSLNGHKDPILTDKPDTPLGTYAGSSALEDIVALDSRTDEKAKLTAIRKLPNEDDPPLTLSSSTSETGDPEGSECGWLNTQCSLIEMLESDVIPIPMGRAAVGTRRTVLSAPWEQSEGYVRFEGERARFKEKCREVYNGLLFSDYPLKNATHSCVKSGCRKQGGKLHLIICVHGLEGSHEDMKLVRTYLERALPMHKLEFLMSQSVHGNTTYRNMEHLTENLVTEIVEYLTSVDRLPDKISFIGHSLGALLVRAAIAEPVFEPYRPLLHTFLSFCGPHLGLINNPSKIVSTGLWFFLKWRKAESLTQLALRDHPDIRETYVYKLSQRDMTHHFQFILLVASAQDHYAPYFSARMEPLTPANSLFRAPTPEAGSARDSGNVTVHNEMARHLLDGIVGNERAKVVRYDVRVPTEGAGVPDNITGRLAHIAVIDSEIFLEKFMAVNVQYFV